MERSDRELSCCQCGQPFNFTGGEQDFYLQNQLQDPKRCKPCRGARKTGGTAQPQGNPQRISPRNAPPSGSAPRRTGSTGFNTQGARMAAPDDPNGYRSPAFQDYNREPYRIDYAGLPKDDDESDGQAAMLGGIRPQQSTGASHSGHTPLVRGNTMTQGNTSLPRGLNGRRPDRAGTDPDAYRSPGFTAEPKSTHAGTGPSRRERRAQRPRFEAACAECGAPALVPFQPAPDRPAFCKPCYQIKKPLLDLGPGKTPRPATASAPTDDVTPASEVSPAT